jgi:epoxyqueuosine reductase
MGGLIYGCDICQEVCPWNEKFSVGLTEPAFAARAAAELPRHVEATSQDKWHPGTAAPPLEALLAMDRESWESFSRGTAMRRAGYNGFRRNVAVALGNVGGSGAKPILEAALTDPDELVREHAAWALKTWARRNEG